MTSRVGVVLFALGRAGQIHAGNMLRNGRVDLRYIVEEDTAKAESFLRANNNTSVQVLPATKAEQAVRDPSVQTAVVCSPTPFHEKYVLMALQAGKAVFCEKPIASSTEATAKCYNEAERAGLPLFCAFNRRFDPGIRRIIQATQNGKLGRIHIIKQTSRDGQVPPAQYVKSSGGIFHDSAIHDLDVALSLAGESPATIHAHGHSFIPHIAELGDMDSIIISMKFPSGTLSQIDVDRTSVYGFDQRIEVLGENGMMRNENHRPNALMSYSEQGLSQDKILESFSERFSESYKHELEHFLDVVLGKTEMEVKREQVMLVSEVASACEKSLRMGTAIKFHN